MFTPGLCGETKALFNVNNKPRSRQLQENTHKLILIVNLLQIRLNDPNIIKIVTMITFWELSTDYNWQLYNLE